MHMSRWLVGFGPVDGHADRLCDLILHEYKFVSRRLIRHLCPPRSILRRFIPFRTIGIRQAARFIAGKRAKAVVTRRVAALMVAPAGDGDWLHCWWISVRFRGPSVVLRDADISDVQVFRRVAENKTVTGKKRCNLFLVERKCIDEIKREERKQKQERKKMKEDGERKLKRMEKGETILGY